MARENEQRPAQDHPRASTLSSPQTDPTNPYHSESVGEWVAGERSAPGRELGPEVTARERERDAGSRD
jgi:hypothetical protein